MSVQKHPQLNAWLLGLLLLVVDEQEWLFDHPY
ncbi:hypothetical protein EMIT0P176_10565 [Pseudomonas sp. IT-P176]